MLQIENPDVRFGPEPIRKDTQNTFVYAIHSRLSVLRRFLISLTREGLFVVFDIVPLEVLPTYLKKLNEQHVE